MDKPITIDDLARMINEGFKATASKDDLTALEDRLTPRLDRIEHLFLAEQKRDIEDLKMRMQRIEDALAVWQTVRSTGPSSAESRRIAMAAFACLGQRRSPKATPHLSPVAVGP